MASAATCVCFCRRFASFSLKSKNRIQFNSLNIKHGNFTALSQQSLGVRYVPICRFSSLSSGLFAALKNDDSQQIKGLADQILKERMSADEKTSSESGESSKKSKAEEEKRAHEFSKRMMKYTFIAFGSIFTGFAGFLIYDWGSPQLAENGTPIEDEFTGMPVLKAYILRTYKEMRHYDKMIKDPSREKLLPEPLTDPYYQPPYTLVLEMTGVLVHPDWTYQTGWRFKKRPGVEFFLQQVATPLYEIVIYTSEQGFTAFPIIDILDPHGYIMYRLFRDATRYLDGHHVKDLSCLNRDLSKVIYLDWNDKSFRLNPENAFKLKKWIGEDGDKTLYDLAIFLRTVATSGVEDVRPVLEFYRQFEDPLEAFKENQKKLQEEQQKKLQEIDKPSFTSVWSGGVFKRR